MASLKSIKSLCTPALIYFVLSVIAFLSMLGKASLMTLVVKAFFILLWTWFLNYLCKKGHSGISWFLVLFPFILMLMIFFFAADVIFSELNLGREGFDFIGMDSSIFGSSYKVGGDSKEVQEYKKKKAASKKVGK
jgi:hypothetical protein